MRDEYIEQALHICGYEGSDSCNMCPVDGKIKDDCQCGSFLAKQALKYINRLKKEIAELAKENNNERKD